MSVMVPWRLFIHRRVAFISPQLKIHPEYKMLFLKQMTRMFGSIDGWYQNIGKREMDVPLFREVCAF